MFSSNASQVSTAANYIEDVFSTYLYTAANQVAQTITNGINLSEKGGLVWIKTRSAAYEHFLADTVRGAANYLQSQSTAAQINNSTELTSFNSNGFSIGTDSSGIINFGSTTLVSWTFRKQAKFFDVVTYTGTGAAQTINHNLGSTPGCMIIKCTSTTSAWYVYHRSVDNGSGQAYLALNTTAAADSTLAFTNTPPTSTVFYVGDGVGQNPINQNGATYVAYLFAHNAGGFGASGTDNVISCGSFNTGGSGSVSVTLNYEPQWVMIKRTDSTSDWTMLDTMRGWSNEETVSSNDLRLNPNLSAAESADSLGFPSATGFQVSGFGLNQTWIYIAIRRGPMKTPTSGTSVFSPIASSAATGTTLTTGFPIDTQIFSLRAGTTNKNNTYDRLRSISSTTTESGRRLITSSTAAETTGNETRLWDNTSFQMPSTFGGASTVFWNFGRAPGFFDQVCYTGTGSATTFNHNLTVAPELMIVKRRSATSSWRVYASGLTSADYALTLNSTAAEASLPTTWNSTAPTSTVFTVGTSTDTNASAGTYVNYLFATLTGVSKVGSYTGTGSLLTVNCGFTSGARFVLIKSADAVGSWYVWDSARGISSSTDPFLLLNSTAAEDTTTNYVDTTSVGFQVTAAASTTVNVSGGRYIFLAIA